MHKTQIPNCMPRFRVGRLFVIRPIKRPLHLHYHQLSQKKVSQEFELLKLLHKRTGKSKDMMNIFKNLLTYLKKEFLSLQISQVL